MVKIFMLPSKFWVYTKVTKIYVSNLHMSDSKDNMMLKYISVNGQRDASQATESATCWC